MKKLLAGWLTCLLVLFSFPHAFAQASDKRQGDTVITMTFGGDCVLGSRKAYKTSAQTFDTYMVEKGYDWPFRNLIDIFSADDLTSINLEGVLLDEESPSVNKPFVFRGLQSYTEILTRSSVEHVNIANNHIDDYHELGRTTTLSELEKAEVFYSGFGHCYVFEKEGYKIGFAGCRETVYKEKASSVANDIKALQEAHCDVIIYSFHWGKEYRPTRTKLQESMADYAIKRGADIIIGTHPHCVQGIDQRKGALVIYSLGNLVFGGTLDMTTFDAFLSQIDLKFSNGVYLGANLRILPVLTSGSAPENDFSPVLAKNEDYQRIMQLIQDDSSLPISSDMWFPATAE